MKKKTIKLKTNCSVVIITKNEEKKLAGCLKSVSLADEIILVDSGSKDKTVKIAKKFGAIVYSFLKGEYSDWRNEGLKHSRGKWVLYLDADERVSSELEAEILKIIKKDELQQGDLTAFAIPRRNFILGKELKHGGWWPDYVKRLFKRESLKKWVGELHEEPVFEGKLGLMQGSLIHLKHDNLGEMVDKTNKWSDIEARLMFKGNHPPMNIPRFLSASFREFWLRMIKERAFLDGTEGIIYALYQVYSKFISYAKLWEMQLEIKNSKRITDRSIEKIQNS